MQNARDDKGRSDEKPGADRQAPLVAGEEAREIEHGPETPEDAGDDAGDAKPHQGGHGTIVAGDEIHKAEYDKGSD